MRVRPLVCLLGLALAGLVPGPPARAAIGDNELIEAIRALDRSKAFALIEDGADVDERSTDGSTALLWAAHYDEAGLVETLLEAGAEADVENNLGATPIAEAAVVGSVDVLGMLLEAGVPADRENYEGQTPLMIVARAGNLPAAKLLIEHGADVNAIESWGGQNALMWAAARSHAAMVELLLEHGADPNVLGAARNWQRRVTVEPRKKIMPEGGFAALHYAARDGCHACIAPLLEYGADIDIHDPDRTTALNLAMLNGNFDIAKTLIEAGADIMKWDFAGRTPLYHAVDMHTPSRGARFSMRGNETSAMDLIVMLLERGANPNMQLKHRPEYREGVNERGADIMLSVGATPLLRAARAGDTEVVRLLLEHGAIADLPNQYGVTPLMAAAGVGFGIRATRGVDATEEDRIATLQVLLEAGAPINRRTLSVGRLAPPGMDNFLYRERVTNILNQNYIYSYVPPDGRAAVHGAARNGFNKVLRFLVENGAELKVAGRDGLTPMDLAAGRYEPEILVPQADPLPETMALLEELCTAQPGCGSFDGTPAFSE